jgi:hypothetical protein
MACIGTSAYWTCDVVSDGIPASPHSPSKEDEPPYHLDGWALLADLVTLYLVTAQRPEIHVVASSSIMRPEAVFLKAPREPVRASHGQQPAACDAGRHQSCCRRHPRSCQTAKTPPNTASAAAAAAPMFFSEVLIRFNCVTEGVAAAQIELTQLDSTQNLAFVLWKRVHVSHHSIACRAARRGIGRLLTAWESGGATADRSGAAFSCATWRTACTPVPCV